MAAQPDPALASLFASGLRDSETLLWTGKPQGRPVDMRYAFYVVVILPWLIGVGFMLLASIGAQSRSEASDSFDIMFLLMPSVMFAFGAWILVFTLAGMVAPMRQIYAVTDKRIIIYGGRFGRAFTSTMKGQIDDIVRSGNDRIGTLRFTKSGDGGLSTIFVSFTAPPDKFFKIANPAEVERLVLDNLFD